MAKKISFTAEEKREKADNIIEAIVQNNMFRAKLLAVDLTKSNGSGATVFRLIFKDLVSKSFYSSFGRGRAGKALRDMQKIAYKYDIERIASVTQTVLLERYFSLLEFILKRKGVKFKKLLTIHLIPETLLYIKPEIFKFLFDTGLLRLYEANVNFYRDTRYTGLLDSVCQLHCAQPETFKGLEEELGLNMVNVETAAFYFNIVLRNFMENIVYVAKIAVSIAPWLVYQAQTKINLVSNDIVGHRLIDTLKDLEKLRNYKGTLIESDDFELFRKMALRTVTQKTDVMAKLMLEAANADSNIKEISKYNFNIETATLFDKHAEEEQTETTA